MFALLLLGAGGVACTRSLRYASAPEATAGDLREPVDAGAGDDAGKKSKRGPVVGSWHGIGKQTDGRQWNMLVTITSTQGSRCATVRYPSLSCIAQWNCGKDARNDGLLEAKEKVVSGRCENGGDVRIERDGDFLKVRIKNGDLQSDATLSPGDSIDEIDEVED